MCSVMWAMPGCAPSKREPARTTRAIAVSGPGTGSWRTVRAPYLRRLGSRRRARIRTRSVTALALALAFAVPAAARTQGDARKAAWLWVAHPGLGEYSNAGWGPFFDRCPQKKFWLGLIP